MTTITDRSALQRVIAVINGKGGVFKTTLVANIGGLLASNGQRVLVVDLDPQGNLAEDFGYRDDDRNDEGARLANALFSGSHAEPVREVRPGLDVFVGGDKLAGAAAGIGRNGSTSTDVQDALARILAPIAGDYDVILIDCPPGEESLQMAAAGAARWVLVPIKSDAASRRGLEAVAGRMELVRGQVAGVAGTNPDIDLLGVVLVDTTTSATTVQREARLRVDGAGDSATNMMFTATIRHSEATAQAARERGVLVHELEKVAAEQPKWFEVMKGEAAATSFAPRSSTSVADDFQAVTEELIGRLIDREAAAAQQAVTA
ncbi:MAG: ParA family protein [Microbacteriaceae bacterium]|nr:ParA family protein [Microbacteriaceae bacterium]